MEENRQFQVKPVADFRQELAPIRCFFLESASHVRRETVGMDVRHF